MSPAHRPHQRPTIPRPKVNPSRRAIGNPTSQWPMMFARNANLVSPAPRRTPAPDPLNAVGDLKDRRDGEQRDGDAEHLFLIRQQERQRSREKEKRERRDRHEAGPGHKGDLAREARSFRVARPDRAPHPHGSGRADSDRDGERERGERQGDLVRAERRLSELSRDQPHQAKTPTSAPICSPTGSPTRSPRRNRGPSIAWRFFGAFASSRIARTAIARIAS